MIGILAELLLSYILLLLIERKNLSILGWQPSTKRLVQLSVGLLLSITLAIIFHLVRSLFTGVTWKINTAYRFTDFIAALWWMLKSVIYEELIFRGALFYIALKRLGVIKGLWLSITAFGIYHWFSFSTFGQPVQMLFIFLITAAAGWMYAYAFLKTNSLYLPIGLHLGWNCVGSILFSEGSIGKHILLPVKDPAFQQNDLMAFLFMMLYQLLVPAFCTWLYVRKLDGEKTYVPPLRNLCVLLSLR
ncbi:MAG: CPBP family intramembrane glutamic endopeptidase [Bacteroidota bacterium]